MLRTTTASTRRVLSLHPSRLPSLLSIAPRATPSSRQNFSSTKPSPNKSRPLALKAGQGPPRPERHNRHTFHDSYLLSDKIKQLAGRKDLDAAIELVRTSPASNVVVWNLLIHEVLQEKKFRRAYELWMDMKRRGLKPTARSYSTFFSGFSKAREIESGALARVKTVYAQWVIHAERTLARSEEKRSIRQEEEGEEGADDITSIPTNAYLTFLANTKNVPLLLETFQAMPTEGPLAPTSMTYSTVLSALRSSEDPEHFQTAMTIWKKLLEEVTDIDTKTVSLIISMCREAARPDDQKVGLEVAKAFYGFVDPAEVDKLVSGKLEKPRGKLDSAGLSNVLSLGLAMQQYNLVVSWFDQVRDYPERFGRMVLEHYQCDLVLVALSWKHDSAAAEDLIQWMRRSPPSLHPTLSSYTNAIQVCWRTPDLPRALRLLSLMTGNPLDLPQPSSPVPATSSTSSPLSTFAPDDRIVSTLLQTSLATRDRGSIYRTLALLETLSFGRDYFSLSAPPPPPTAPRSPYPPYAPKVSTATISHAAFWKYKLAEVLERSLERVLQGGDKHLDSARRRELAIWRGDVVRWLEVKEEEGKQGRAERGEEESMRGRREVLREREAKRETAWKKKKEVEVEEVEERDPWRSDIEPKEKLWGRENRGAGDRKSWGQERDSERRDFRRPREDRDERSGWDSRSGERENRGTTSRAPPPREDNPVERAQWQQAPVEAWPERVPPPHLASPSGGEGFQRRDGGRSEGRGDGFRRDDRRSEGRSDGFRRSEGGERSQGRSWSKSRPARREDSGWGSGGSRGGQQSWE